MSNEIDNSQDQVPEIKMSWVACSLRFIAEKNKLLEELNSIENSSEKVAKIRHKLEVMEGQIDLIVRLSSNPYFDKLTGIASHYTVRLGLTSKSWPIWIMSLGDNQYGIEYRSASFSDSIEVDKDQLIVALQSYVELMRTDPGVM